MGIVVKVEKKVFEDCWILGSKLPIYSKDTKSIFGRSIKYAKISLHKEHRLEIKEVLVSPDYRSEGEYEVTVTKRIFITGNDMREDEYNYISGIGENESNKDEFDNAMEMANDYINR